MKIAGLLSHSQKPTTRPYPELDQSSPCPYPTSWITNLILSSPLCLRLPSKHFLWSFPTTPCLHLFSTQYLSRPSPRFDIPNNIWWRVRIFKLLIMYFSPLPVTLSSLDLNIILSSLLSNTLSLRSFLNLSDQVSHPYKTTSKSVVLWILKQIYWTSKVN